MNEQKLNELVEQAIAQNENDWPHFRNSLAGSGSLYLHVFAETLIELMVLEVLDKVGNRWSTGDIKQYFGVEQ